MQISNAEWQVMKVIWMRDGLTSSQLHAILAAKFAWSPSTTKTLLRRLVTKGMLVAHKEGNKFHYSALMTEKESICELKDEVQDKTCAMNVKYVVAELIDTSDFTMADLDMLAAKIEAKRSQAVSEVKCNCMS